jgi:hypothetical protein
METLNNAARAAGFAMAASEDPHETIRTEATPEAAQWRPGEAVLRSQPPRPGRVGDWAKSLLGLFGRRAPASPA